MVETQQRIGRSLQSATYLQHLPLFPCLQVPRSCEVGRDRANASSALLVVRACLSENSVLVLRPTSGRSRFVSHLLLPEFRAAVTCLPLSDAVRLPQVV